MGVGGLCRGRSAGPVTYHASALQTSFVSKQDDHAGDVSGAGGPSALNRLDRDVFAKTGVRTLVVLEGINDIKANPA
jgi:hypothetical protein